MYTQWYGPSNVALWDRKHDRHWAKCTEVTVIYPSHTLAIMVRRE